MDLNEYAVPKLTKEKRDRQPNWTEAEKQLLLSLTRKHRDILESKSSDVLSIKRKSETWDSIALQMKLAGYNRSKDRLKQQLGRLKAADSKNRKSIDQNNQTSNSPNSQTIKPQLSTVTCDTEPINLCIPMTQNGAVKNTMTPASILDDKTNSKSENAPTSSQSPDLEESDTTGESSNVDDDAEQLMYTDVHATSSAMDIIEKENLSGNTMNTSTTANNLTQMKSEGTLSKYFKATSLINIPKTRTGQLRQLHMHRIAVEKERLCILRLQKRRDRTIYEKSIQIQDLQLNILQDMLNRSRKNNPVN